MPGRRVRTTAQRSWIDWAYARSDRFPPRGVTPLTPIMGRATDPGENHDPGKGQFYFQLDPDAPIREQPRTAEGPDPPLGPIGCTRCLSANPDFVGRGAAGLAGARHPDLPSRKRNGSRFRQDEQGRDLTRLLVNPLLFRALVGAAGA